MKNNRCIANLLKFINLLQINSTTDNIQDKTCTRPYLGPICRTICYNTRPITLYTKNGDLFETTYTLNNETLTSSTFRVEKVEDNCVTLLILATNPDGTFTNTNSFITVNLKCICAVKCLNDTVVENLCNSL